MFSQITVTLELQSFFVKTVKKARAHLKQNPKVYQFSLTFSHFELISHSTFVPRFFIPSPRQLDQVKFEAALLLLFLAQGIFDRKILPFFHFVKMITRNDCIYGAS